jgi:NAD(P)-dependent dehydrogenase (short-subunit alcohol dehydrogenase family)
MKQLTPPVVPSQWQVRPSSIVRRDIVDIAGSVALVTGANRGLGAAFCRALLDQGASKVYAGARNPDTIKIAGVIPVRLDITSPADVAAAVANCGDVTLLINNAGILTVASVLADDALEAGRREFETNVFGTLSMSRSFAPVLGANGGGAIINVLSVLSWLSVPAGAMYSASKAAAWSITNALRLDLLDQHTQVVALHVGYMDTDMTAGVDAPKASPDDVAVQALAGVASGAFEVLADDTSRYVRSALSGDLTALYPTLVSTAS